MSNSIPKQTPLYYSTQKERYSRQQQIKDIQEHTGRELIVYIANISHPYSGIDQSDVLAINDLLHDKNGKDLDLLLQSPGGDIDVAEKLIYMCRNNCKSFRVIVAESAKSAATLIALSADSIIMSDTSELGPIDPQVMFPTSTGQAVYRPAQSFLDGLKAIQEETKNNDGNLSPVYFPLLQQLDPALIDYCKKAVLRSKKFATKWLLESQCKGNKRKAQNIARKLADTKRYLSHGTVIDHKEALNDLGLCIDYLKPDDELWQRIWRLYCCYEVDLRDSRLIKIFESDTVSIPLSSQSD
ncbi:MAG: SDH family Clp fold serine proteinase [Eubacteriales bacterium]